MEMPRSKCKRNTRLSHRSYTCQVDFCSQRFGAEQQLKEHVRKVHADFDSKGGENTMKNNIKIHLLNHGKVETFEDLDDEDVLNKFNELAISDAISFADKKDDFVKRKRKPLKNLDDLEEDNGMQGHLEWIQNEVAIQRMEEIMRGEFHSYRHNLFLKRQERECLCLSVIVFVSVNVIVFVFVFLYFHSQLVLGQARERGLFWLPALNTSPTEQPWLSGQGRTSL